MKFILWTVVWLGLNSISGWIVLYKYGEDALDTRVEKYFSGYVIIFFLWIIIYVLIIR